MPTRVFAPVLLAAAVVVVGACGSSMSEQAYNYCVNEAPPGELDAAAEALNIAPDADRDFETAPNRDDPAFQRVCEYAWNARNQDADAPAGGDPAGASQTAPLDPQRSADAPPPEEASPAVPQG